MNIGAIMMRKQDIVMALKCFDQAIENQKKIISTM